MTIKTNLDDRKELAKHLIPFNHNEKLHYAGYHSGYANAEVS